MAVVQNATDALRRAWRAFRGKPDTGYDSHPQVEMTRALCEQIAVLSTYAAGFRGVPTVMAESSLPVLEAVQYTVPAGYNAIITEIQGFNNHATTQTALFTLKPGSTNRDFIRAVLATNQRVEWQGELTLEAGDVIRGSTTTASALNYTIHGYLVPV